METFDDELLKFEAEGAAPLPFPTEKGEIEREGARIHYASFGHGQPVILLHGGLGHGGNWGHQVPALLNAGYRAILIDSRGHGHSTRDERPYSYDLLAADVLAVMDKLRLEKVSLVGWSDGACTALVLAAKDPLRVVGVFFFACNVDATGTKPFEMTTALNRCFSRHVKDYMRLSPTPNDFNKLLADLTPMQQSQPNYSKDDLAKIQVPVAIVQGEHDEFIKREHAEYIARTIPNAELIILKDVSHFAPLQRPQVFNAAMLRFLNQHP